MAETPRLICVPPDRFGEFWPHLEPLIRKAHERFGSNDEREELEAALRQGKALAWIAWSPAQKIEAVLVTDLMKEDGVLICRLRALAGRKLQRWLRLLDEVEQFARREGCAAIRFIGRPGWSRMLRDYHVTHVQAQKRL